MRPLLTITILSLMVLGVCGLSFCEQSESRDAVLAEKREAFGMATRGDSASLAVQATATVIVPDESPEPEASESVEPSDKTARPTTPEVSIREIPTQSGSKSPQHATQNTQVSVESGASDSAEVSGIQDGESAEPERDRPDRVALLTANSDEAKPEGQTAGSAAIAVLSTIGKLVLVCLLAYLVLLALKYMYNKRDIIPARTRDLRVVDMVRLSPSSSLHLLEIEGKKLLIGCSSNQVNLLQELEGTESLEPAEEPNSRFAEYLEKYSSGSASDNPTGRISGLLRECAGYLRQRCAGNPTTGKSGVGDKRK